MERKTKSTEIIAYKGFDKDLSCRGYAYEVGKAYEHDGTVSVCNAGFHACESPLDVLNYYDLCDSRFAVVKASGEISKNSDGDSKIASGKITIEAELKLPEFIGAAVNWMLANVKSTKNVASGNGSNLAASGDYSKLAASGDDSKLAASGNGSKLAASGNGSNLAASGDYSKLAASGDGSKLAASGYGSKLAASGNGSNLAASGDGSKLAASGDGSNLAASGNGSRAKAGKNGAIALAYHDGKRGRFAVGYVGEDGIKADTWYKADATTGKLVEC